MDLKSGNLSQKIATDIVNLALTIRSEKTKVFISGLTIRNDNLDKRRKEVNQEAATGGVLWKKVFLEVSQISQLWNF